MQTPESNSKAYKTRDFLVFTEKINLWVVGKLGSIRVRRREHPEEFTSLLQG